MATASTTGTQTAADYYKQAFDTATSNYSSAVAETSGVKAAASTPAIATVSQGVNSLRATRTERRQGTTERGRDSAAREEARRLKAEERARRLAERNKPKDPTDPAPPGGSNSDSVKDALEKDRQRELALERGRVVAAENDAENYKRDRDKYKGDYEYLKGISDRMREMREDQELNRLRSGVSSGGSNATRGSLEGGSAVTRDYSSRGTATSERRRSMAQGDAGSRLAAGGGGGSTAAAYTSRFG